MHHLIKLLRSFFNGAELRQFISSLENGNELLVHLSPSVTSLAEACSETASLLDRWGISEAEIFSKLHQHRPARLPELIAYHRLRAAAPTTVANKTISLELMASIDGTAVGVYRIHPGQVKMIGRSSEAEIQFPVELVKLSRLHAWASWPPGGPMVQDLDSKNGTWVNGRRVDRGPLQHGDQVQLGEINLAIHEPDRTETVGPPADDTLS